jgi:hypothetical protein
LCEMAVDMRSKLSCNKSEIQYLNDEVDRLRTSLEAATKELEVFKKGIPCAAILDAISSWTSDSDQHDWLSATDWLRRIAARGSE